MSELKPCPMCGHEASINTVTYARDSDTARLNRQEMFYGVNCIRCGLNNRGVVGHRTAQEAADAWNTRALSPEPQEPGMWFISDGAINGLQVRSIRELIERAKRAHWANVTLRINGKEEIFQADWIKHLLHFTPPHAQPREDDKPSAPSISAERVREIALFAVRRKKRISVPDVDMFVTVSAITEALREAGVSVERE